jgi:hypothetical protein
VAQPGPISPLLLSLDTRTPLPEDASAGYPDGEDDAQHGRPLTPTPCHAAQVLLSQVHRLRALVLLGRFLDMGPWAVELALSVGIFPYVLKLLQTTSTDLRCDGARRTDRHGTPGWAAARRYRAQGGSVAAGEPCRDGRHAAWLGCKQAGRGGRQVAAHPPMVCLPPSRAWCLAARCWTAPACPGRVSLGARRSACVSLCSLVSAAPRWCSSGPKCWRWTAAARCAPQRLLPAPRNRRQPLLTTRPIPLSTPAQVDLVKDSGHLYFIQYLDSMDGRVDLYSRAQVEPAGLRGSGELGDVAERGL